MEFSNRVLFDNSSLIQWTFYLSFGSIAITSECGPYNLVGGFDVFSDSAWLSKSFNDLLPHYKVGIFFDLYLIDSWDYPETFMMFIDSNLMWERKYDIRENNVSIQSFVCGSRGKDHFETVYQIFSHFSQTLDLKMTTNLSGPSNDEAWGINNFQISLFLCYPTCLTCSSESKTDCLTCYSSFLKNSSTNECECLDGYFLKDFSNPCQNYPCSECASCSLGCKKCTNESYCLLCFEPYFFNKKEQSCVTQCPLGFLLKEDGRCYACDNLCKSCDDFSSQSCLSCYDSNVLLNKTCISTCPQGYYEDSNLKKCELCHISCKNCSGWSEKQCISCEETKFFLKDFKTCWDICPNYYFSSSKKMECLSCPQNCKICKDQINCMNCSANSKLVNNSCKFIKEIKGELIEENNPYLFKISLNENWDYFFKNYQIFVKSVSVQNFESSIDYKYSSFYNESTKTMINFIFYYFQTFKTEEKILKIWLMGEDDFSDSSIYRYINQNFSQPLNSLATFCSFDQYFSKGILYLIIHDLNKFYLTFLLEKNKCVPKNKLLISLIYDSNPLILQLFFSIDFPNSHEYIQKFSSLAIDLFSSNDFNYTLKNSSRSSNHSIILSSKKDIVNRPLLKYTLNLSDSYLLEHNIYMPTKISSINLFDYYILSEQAQAMANSINSQSGTTQSVGEGSGYAAAFFSSGSLFVQGLMLIEMIFLIKFMDINYPPIVKQMFEKRDNGRSFIFKYSFQEDLQDKQVVPNLFQYYKVSVYFLNNIGEVLCQICLITLIASIFLHITPYDISKKPEVGIFAKVMIFIRDSLVWETTLFLILMNLQKIVFFVTCSWMFPASHSFTAVINLAISTFVGFILILWVLHLWVKIKVCQSFKENNLSGNGEDDNDKSKVQSFVKNDVNSTFSLLESPTQIPASPVGKEISSSPISYKKKHLQITTDDNIKAFDVSTIRILDSSSDKKKTKINEKKSICLPKKLSVLISSISDFLYHTKNSVIYLRRYRIFHLDFKSKLRIHRYYPFLNYFRQCLLSMLTVTLYAHPFFQIIVINAVNFTFLVYSFFSRPFTTYYSFIVCLVNEMIVQTAFFSGMMLAIFDYMKNYDVSIRMDFGWVIIFSNSFLLYWVIGTGILRPVFFWLYEFCKKRRGLNKVHNSTERKT